MRQSLSHDERFADTRDDIVSHGNGVPHAHIYPVTMAPEEWADWPTDNAQTPDPRTLTTLMLECRSAEWIAYIGALIANGVEAPVWIIDDDMAWDAGCVDPLHLKL